MRRALAAVLGGALLSVVACNALTGVGDLGVGGDRGVGGTGSDAGRLPDGAFAEGGGNGDGGAVPPVTPSLAKCGDKALCLPNGNGWSPALHLLAGVGSTCPAEWPDRAEYKTPGGGSCDCKCVPNGPACDGPLEARSGAVCNGPVISVPVPPDGNCVQAPALPTPVALMALGEPPSSCGSAVGSALAPPQPATTCSGATATTSPSCDPGEVCVPEAGSVVGIPMGLSCIAHDGEVACPQNLPVRVVVGASVNDGRSCSTSCSCESTSCKDGKLEAFGGETCTNLLRTFEVDGKCKLTSAPAAQSFRYTPAAGCKVKQAPQVLGTQTVQAPRTLCCVAPFGGGGD